MPRIIGGKTVKELITALKTLPQNAKFMVSSDEELNSIFQEWQVADIGENKFVLFGFSGTELDD